MTFLLWQYLSASDICLIYLADLGSSNLGKESVRPKFKTIFDKSRQCGLLKRFSFQVRNFSKKGLNPQQINPGLTNVVPVSILIACLEQSADTINFKCQVRNPESSQRHAGEAHDLKLWREKVLLGDPSLICCREIWSNQEWKLMAGHCSR